MKRLATLAVMLLVFSGGAAVAHEECGGMCDLDHHLEHERAAKGGAGHLGSHDPQGMGTRGLHAGPHMKLTALRAAGPDDLRRADEIVQTLRTSLAKYTDSRTAERDGYEVYHPELRMKMYHFTNWAYGAAAAFRFDPARPTSLLYEKARGAYKLVGAMYTAPAAMSEDDLHRRVPLSVAHWHTHVNICLAPPGTRGWAALFTFGLMGSIATAEACEAAGGRFLPHYYGWMLHAFPWETEARAIWAHTH